MTDRELEELRQRALEFLGASIAVSTDDVLWLLDRLNELEVALESAVADVAEPT